MTKEVNPSTPLRVNAERSRGIKNIEDSVRARLHNKRKETGIPFMEILRNGQYKIRAGKVVEHCQGY